TARYGHNGSGRTGGQLANQPLPAVHTPDRHAGHGLDPADRSPQPQPARRTPSGMGRSPASSYAGSAAQRLADPGVGLVLGLVGLRVGGARVPDLLTDTAQRLVAIARVVVPPLHHQPESGGRL